ncbi:hypothetical protein GAY31_13765 [Azospirillum brasilense]|nr:hypothetical protein [Azospirillum brasilense]
MARRDVEQEILAALDAFVADGGALPATPDRKVNAAALCRALGLRPSDTQHLFRKDSLKLAINALAESQRLLPLGARADRTAADQQIEAGISRVAALAKVDAQAAAEQAAACASVMLGELAKARAEIERLRMENVALSERLRCVEEGGLPPRF